MVKNRKKRAVWIRPRHAEDRAWNGLQELLESGAYPPGARLPSERVMCEKFGISRVTLRRAMKRLIRANRVDARVGSGTFIKRPPPSSRRDIISLMYIDEKSVPPEVYKYASDLGCELKVFSQIGAKWEPDNERAFLRSVRDEQHRGLLAFCTPLEPHSDSILRDIEHSGVRVVHIEHGRLTLPRQGYLLPDFRRAGHMATVELMLAGYRHLYWLVYADNQAPFVRLIRQGVEDALAEHRPDLNMRKQLIAYPTADHGQEARVEQMCKMLKTIPENSGVIAFTPSAALDVLEFAEKLGVEVPGKLGVIGIDVVGSRVAEQAETRVDVLSFDRPKLLKRALDCILADDWDPPHELIMPTRVRCGSVRE